MNCPNCGHEARGRFCTMCGTRVEGRAPLTRGDDQAAWRAGIPVAMPAASPALPADSTVLLNTATVAELKARISRPQGGVAPVSAPAAPNEETVATSHFRLHAPSGSFAAENLEAVGPRLESAYRAIVSVLAIEAPPGTMDVYLNETLADAQGRALDQGGYVLPDRSQIYEVYRPDAPGSNLERSLFFLLLARSLNRQEAPSGFVVDGLMALVLQRLGSFPSDEEVGAALAAARKQKELPALSALLAGSAGENPIYFPAAAAFARYLLGLGGIEKVKALAVAESPGEAVQSIYGQSLGSLEKGWRKSLKAGSPGGVTRFITLLGPYLRPYWRQVTEVLIYLGFSVAFGIGMAKLQGTLLDKALLPRDLHALAVIMTILGVAFVVVSVTSLRQSYLTASVSEGVLRELRLRIFSLVQRLHPGFFQTMDTGDIMSRMTSDLAAVEMALSMSLVMSIRMVLMIVAAIVTIFFTDWKLALIVVLGSPLFFVVARFMGPAAANASKERQESLAQATTTLQEDLGAQPVIKAFGLQQYMIGRYVRDLDRVFRSSLRLTFLSGLFGLSSSSISSAVQLIVLGVGAWLVIGGNLSAGTLFAFLALSAQVIGPMQGMAGVVQGLQQATGAMDRVEDLLAAEPAIVDAPGAQTLTPISREIALEHVSFGYSDDQLILRDLSLTIPAGASVAVVGPSGCGKSTLLNLLLRFYDPQEGRVTFDGVDIRQATVESVRGQSGVVLQENVLFNMSLRENIRLGRLDATDQEVEEAAKAAEIHDLIMEMPEGYDTTVGERGSRLSGGQRQRVAIARAIIRNPALLLLDEATSALDLATEAAINATLDRLTRGRTTVNVTHRLTSIVNADRIYVLDHGKVIEQGTHDELVKQGGLYARLWQEQGGGVIQTGVQYVGVEASRLHGVPLFSTLEPDLLASLAQRLAVERYPAGEIIVRQGEVGDKLYIVHRGQVEVFAFQPTQQQPPLAVLHDGDYFGEMALVSDRPRNATVRARTPVQLYSLQRRDFLDLLSAQPQMAREVMQVAKQRYAETSRVLATPA
jgi:ATP-binding cassette subfamily B protein